MSLISEISTIRSLTKDLRNTAVSEETARSIEKIHDVLKTSTESQAWHRVDWRSRGGNGHYRSNAGAGNTPQNNNYRGFTGNRSGNQTTSPQISINRTGGSAPVKPIPAKYVSPFKSSSEKIDETILNTVILGKLNKFSPANYEDTMNFMCQILDSGETAFLKDFMKLVFQKATTEEIFCPLYARLLSELSDRYKFLLSEMEVLYKEYMAIFEEVSEVETSTYDELIKRTSEKKYRLGYSVFLAELVKNNVLDRDLLLLTIRKITDQITKVSYLADLSKIGEEYVDCLFKIICALNQGKSDEICKICEIIEKELPDTIYPFTAKKSENKLTMKARFALLDVYETLKKSKENRSTN